jgi:maltooligosyltrehalose trehalohydrolase
VVLDVVYNHLGPEGNYLGDFGPYFTDRYRTPWGQAVNFDGPESDHVRRYFIENALYWQTEFHVDALRLDAVHSFHDGSAQPFLAELAEITHRQAARLGRRFHLIAESDLNDVRTILPPALSGDGLDAQWSDDFHHSLHVALTGESLGYYRDFDGLTSLARAWREGYAYTGQYSIHRRRRHGNSPRAAHPQQFVVCSQNHDQIGNRRLGQRLSALVDFDSLKLAAAATLLSPFLPLLFMGEEYGETAPFQYFISHSDPALADAVRRGRKAEFASFHWRAGVPDPQDPATFNGSRVRPELAQHEPHRTLLRFHQELFRIRDHYAALTEAKRDSYEVTALPGSLLLLVHYHHADAELFLILAFGSKRVRAEIPVPAGPWRKRLDSADRKWRGRGPAQVSPLNGAGTTRITLARRSAVLYERSL